MPFPSSPPPPLYPVPREGGEGRVRGGRKVRGQRRAPMKTGELFIGGNWRPSLSGETYATINPATEEESARVAKGDERDVDLAVAAARKAFDSGPWPKMSAAERGRIVWKLGVLIKIGRAQV